jgi:hypothetical protein
LENWVKQRGSKNSSKFDKDLLVEMLAPISFYIHQNCTTGLISESVLRMKISEEYKRINPYLNAKEEKQDVKDIIEFLREDAGFLFEKGYDERGESTFGFVHQTFQEYFSSIEFKTRWKEGTLKNNFDEYVFSSNWREVIKLTASLFKLNEPSRLGRQYATNFIKDILNVNDTYPEIFRPLKVVIEILNEDTEIEFELFVELIDQIFNEVLCNEEDDIAQPFEYNREVSIFSHALGRLIDTKTYQSYLIERITKEITNDKCPDALQFNLMQVFIVKSKIPIIKDELIKLLKSNNDKVRRLIFNYNTVMPVAEIIFTDEFRCSIVSYINTEEFVKNYNGYLPAQYHCCFETTASGDIKSMLKESSFDAITEKIKEEGLLSIRLIENKKIREDYINFIVFSIGMSDIDDLKDYIKTLKNEYPKLKFPRIEKYIKELELFNSYDLEEYELISFKSTKIYLKKDTPSIFGFIKGKDFQYLEYPFKKSDLEPYFKEDTEAFLVFLSQTIPVLNKAKAELFINDINSLLNFIEYQKTFHWHSRIETKLVLNYALNCLFDKKIIPIK